MSYLDGREEYVELEEVLMRLLKGTIVHKNIDSRTHPDLQWSEDDTVKGRHLEADTAGEIESQLKRYELVEARLKTLEGSSPSLKLGSEGYRMMVLTDDELLAFAHAADGLGHRSCLTQLENFLTAHDRHRVLVLYGLRHTGKTTLMQQAILAMSSQERSNAAFIESLPGDTMSDLAKDLRLLRRQGYTTIFIDEVTLLPDFIDSAAMLADVFAAMGMAIVLSGADSLGFWIASGNALYDRCAFIHTTFIPFAEWYELLGMHDIDDYIAYGGTLTGDAESVVERGMSQPRSPFADIDSTRRYIDMAIAHNIQHTLEHYRDGGRFGSLYSLYERGELTYVINRVIKDMNRWFVLLAIDRTIVSGDLHSSMQLLRNAADPDKWELDFESGELEDIEDYLLNLELIERVGIVSLTPKGRRRESGTYVFVQPGMRFCQAKALVHSLCLDTAFQELPRDVRSVVEDKILNEVRSRLLKDIVLLETKRALGGTHEVFKLLVEGNADADVCGGEYDMAVYDEATDTVDLYEVKHSDKMVPAQTQHLTDSNKLALVERMIGTVTRRVVLHLGPSGISDDIEYQNVEDYLRELRKVRG